MSKSTKAVENTAEVKPEAPAKETVEVKPEASAKETVTVSKEDFERILADMKIQLAGELRAELMKDSRTAAEEAELEQIRKANERAEELVTIHVDAGSIKGNKNIDVAINGVQYVVQRGKDVQVPRKVAEVIMNAQRQREIAYGLQDKRSQEFERELEKQNA